MFMPSSMPSWPSENLLRQHKGVWKLKFKLTFSLRPGLGLEGIRYHMCSVLSPEFTWRW